MDSVKSRYGKPLDVRNVKKEWFALEHLENLRSENRKFCEYTLNHPHRVSVDQCCICQSKDSAIYGTTYNIPYCQCTQCHHVYAKYKLKQEDLEKYYKGKYFENSTYLDKAQVSRRMQAMYEPKVSYVAEQLPGEKQRWLDVGAGNGSIVACARAMGFEAEGIELGENAIQFAREIHGIEMHCHTIDKEFERCGAQSYDIVSFFMVLEHVEDPVFQIREAWKLLRNDGKLVIEVPKADSVAAWGDIVYANNGMRQMVSDHVMLYTLDSINYLLGHNGFVAESRWFMGQDIFNTVIHLAIQEPSFLQSALCKFLLDFNDELQLVVDRQGLCDEVIVIAKKTDKQSPRL